MVDILTVPQGSSSDEEPERQRGGLADDGESCFLTGLHHPGVSPIASPRRVDESESDTASSSSSEYDGEAKLEAAMLDCAVAKRKAKRNARRGTIKLRADDEREVKTYQEDVAKLKAERRRKEEDAQPKPMVRTVHDCPEAISRLARPEPRPEPRIYSEPQPTFQAKPLPKTYGAPAARSGTIVERSQAWLAEKRALRDAERERRRKEKEAEVTAKPRLADPGPRPRTRFRRGVDVVASTAWRGDHTPSTLRVADAIDATRRRRGSRRHRRTETPSTRSHRRGRRAPRRNWKSSNANR